MLFQSSTWTIRQADLLNLHNTQVSLHLLVHVFGKLDCCWRVYLNYKAQPASVGAARATEWIRKACSLLTSLSQLHHHTKDWYLVLTS